MYLWRERGVWGGGGGGCEESKRDVCVCGKEGRGGIHILLSISDDRSTDNNYDDNDTTFSIS